MTELFDRDGTSQAHRIDPALNPEFIAVDERVLKDWLAFAQAFSRELKYFDSNNQASGDWSSFLTDMTAEQLKNIDLSARWQDIEKFLAAPEKFDDSFRRPHFVLFLAFLQLLKLTQGRLNNLTRRHLDFYFQEVLRLQKKQGIPDRVHIIVDASPYVDQTKLPAGTLLNAGKDNLGNDLVYSTDNDIIVNHAQIAQLSSVFVHKQITDLRAAREQNQTENKGIIEMLKIALGDPVPGDNLPLYRLSKDQQKQPTFAFLKELQALVKFARAETKVENEAILFLDLWELRSLMLVKKRQQNNKDRGGINTTLEEIGKKRGITLKQPITDEDYYANFITVLGDGDEVLKNIPGFKELPLVKNIYDVYRESGREDVQNFIKDQLVSLAKFTEMMKLKTNIDNDWRYINTLLEQAGKRRSPPVSFPNNFKYESPDFNTNLTSMLGTLNFPTVAGIQSKNLDEYYQAIQYLEKYFFMKAEDFLLIMDAVDAQTPDWEAIYEKLTSAYREKVYAARRTKLAGLKTKSTLTLDEQKQAIEDMINLAFDDANVDIVDPNVKERIISLLPKGLDLSVVNKITNPNNKDLLQDDEWQTVYEQLELVWRNRLGIEPVAQKVEWLYLSANNDAKSVIASADASRWKTFGQTPDIFAQTQAPEAKLGWIICSPLLALSQGYRTVTLKLTFQQLKISDQNFALLSANKNSLFNIQLSSEKGWIKPTKANMTIEPEVLTEQTPVTVITWVLEFNESIPPITPLPAENIFINNPYPVLRLLLLPRWEKTGRGRYITDYPLFQSLLLEKVLLSVDVKGLTNFHVQNDDTIFNSVKPFEPFGSQPSVGSRLYFGHSELVSKRLKSIDLNLQWMGVPNDLKTHYTNYGTPYPKKTGTTITQSPIENQAFKAILSLLDQNQEIKLTIDDGTDLFEATNANTPHKISIAPITAKNRQNYNYQRDLTAIPTNNDLETWQRYFYLELNTPDFQHSTYPAVAAAMSIKLATAIATTTVNKDAATYQVNPPYTPKLKSISINYASEEEIVLANYQTGGAEQIFHQHPFGYAEIQVTKPGDNKGFCNFLPGYDNEGELYIGLNNVKPPQQLAILMQMAEGSANPNLDLATVEWSYLSGNNWISLHNSNTNQGHIQSDATNGLIDSGIIQLQLESVLPNTLLPSQLYWLRAAVAKNCDSVCDTVDAHTQAVVATFVNQDNSPDHLNQPLPVDTISKTVEPIADILALHQPYTSFGGKPVEQDAIFNTRVSERLRHKQRALTTWDYERLILENFPQIYKAKCLTQAQPKHPADLGKTDIIVIPDIRGRFPFNPFEPKAPAGMLSEISEFLDSHIPPFASITVKNAHYVAIKVRVAVRFMPNLDTEFYKRQLNNDLNRFLAPWAYDANADIVIGGSIYANAIINFIDRLDYVDYLAKFKLFSSEYGISFRPVFDTAGSEGYRVQAGRPDGVLVATHEHEIDLINEALFVNQDFTGINYMRIELDFIVG